ncbi:hypothetical protein A1O3_03785 [Capronia epimyces CBS 606.96]|uniref:Uncharacterized protein n=1 Tax=Capronia epimyces CBS 606.96 TaxID=1182542 RepID=W9YC72_9EURO|nr:uncharacterized protein A1O3_03785 [Capronia epimyces CBS 606.96]EXJ86831.1 hypothetical protein A1O3_03785 [Capronia epimyces CBS 606.96]
MLVYIGNTTTIPSGSHADPGVVGVPVFSQYVVDSVTLDETPGMSPFAETVTYAPDRLQGSVRDSQIGTDRVSSANKLTATISVTLKLQCFVVEQLFSDTILTSYGVEFYKGASIFYSLDNLIFYDVLT